MAVLRDFARTPATKSDAGQAAEHLVASDLLARGFRVTKPLNTNGAHDLHAHIGGAWRTIQVKCGRRDGKSIQQPRSMLVVSDILALVWLPTKEIRYIEKTEGACAGL